jgi:hypothetical protein
MFNFSANHLLLLSRMEYRSCVVFLMQDHSTRRVYRLYDFTKSQIITSDHFYCVSGKVNSADRLYLVIEAVKRDTKHSPEPQLRLQWGRGSITRAPNHQWQGKTRNDHCMTSDAVSGLLRPPNITMLTGSSQTGGNGSFLNRR